MTELPLNMDLPWQADIWIDLNTAIDNNRLSHALLISGASGIGKKNLALRLAGRVLCSSPNNHEACGKCKNCQLLAAGFHPDLMLVEPADKGKAILIDKIRRLTASLNNTSQQGGWRVAIIAPAEAMNINSANAVLKSLEEPQAKTLLILVCHRPSLLPATIISRCQKLPLPIPKKEIAVRWLSEVSKQHPSVTNVLQMAVGRPLLALEALDAGGLETFESFIKLIESVRSGEQTPLGAAQRSADFATVEALEWFLHYVRKIATTDVNARANVDLYYFLDRLQDNYRMILKGSTINQQLLWEETFMSWSQVFTPR